MSLYNVEPNLFRRACYCNAQSVGSAGICQTTQAIDGVISNRGIQLAAQNDKVMLDIIRNFAPEAYAVTSVRSGKIILSAVNELNGYGLVGEAYQITDLYTCALNDTGARIYDYSVVGTRLLSEMKMGVFYHGSDQTLEGIIGDFGNLQKNEPIVMGWNKATAAIADMATSSNHCPFTISDPVYMANLAELNKSLFYGAQNGADEAQKYVDFVTPIRENAEGARENVSKEFSDSYSLHNLLSVVFGIHRIQRFLEAQGTYSEAEEDYNKGLFIKAGSEYQKASEQYKAWKAWSWPGILLDTIIWAIVAAILIALWFFFFRGNEVFCKLLTITNNSFQ
ncbi:MAG: hypothetical protein V1822_01820 [Candidatus Micrarchaeota archaeon]